MSGNVKRLRDNSPIEFCLPAGISSISKIEIELIPK